MGRSTTLAAVLAPRVVRRVPSVRRTVRWVAPASSAPDAKVRPAAGAPGTVMLKASSRFWTTMAVSVTIPVLASSGAERRAIAARPQPFATPPLIVKRTGNVPTSSVVAVGCVSGRARRSARCERSARGNLTRPGRPASALHEADRHTMMQASMRTSMPAAQRALRCRSW
jgi:hypothetical protein